MITKTQMEKRAQTLINRDNQTDDETQKHYQQALLFITAYIYSFYNHYQVDGKLSLAQTSALLDEWDKSQYQQALTSLGVKEWTNEAKQRVRSIGSQAGYNKTRLLTAIAKLAVVKFGMNLGKIISRRTEFDGNEQVRFIQRNMYTNPNTLAKMKHIVLDPDAKKQWSDALWTDTDTLANRVEELVNKGLRKGLDQHEIERTLRPFANPKQFKAGETITSKLHTMDANARQLVRTETARITNEINLTSYKDNDVTMVNWVTEPGACDKCADLADNSPYPIENAPDIPGDSHPNCRCSLIPAGTSHSRFIYF